MFGMGKREMPEVEDEVERAETAVNEAWVNFTGSKADRMAAIGAARQRADAARDRAVRSHGRDIDLEPGS